MRSGFYRRISSLIPTIQEAHQRLDEKLVKDIQDRYGIGHDSAKTVLDRTVQNQVRKFVSPFQ